MGNPKLIRLRVSPNRHNLNGTSSGPTKNGTVNAIDDETLAVMEKTAMKPKELRYPHRPLEHDIGNIIPSQQLVEDTWSG